MKVQTCFSIELKDLEYIDKIANRKNTSRSDYIREILQSHLKKERGTQKNA